MNMVQQVSGVICIVFCILAGSFIIVMSIAEMVDGEEDPILFGYISGGVILIFAGLFLWHSMSRKDVEEIKTEDLEDESW
jgi:hypothetical protein